MRLPLPQRKTKKYFKIVVIFFIIYSFGQFAVFNQNSVLISFRDNQNRSIFDSALQGIFKFYVVQKPDVVIYSEDEVQIQLKGIHERGKKVIGLKEDECKKRLPECLIFGNFKCGTQELLEFMRMHPRIRIYREPAYELHYFSGNYGKGPEWYRKQMPCSYSGQITVEKTPDYYQDPKAPLRIKQMNPNMKLIAMVRDPIERALSHFSFLNDTQKKYGYQFERCAFTPGKGVNKNCFAIRHSIYDEGIQRYFNVFNKSQILIINNDDFRNDPYKVLRDIESFLGIEHVILRKHFAYIEEKGFYCVRSVLNETLVACYDQRRGRKSGPKLSVDSLSNTTLKALKEYFKPMNERFFNAIGRTYNWPSNIL